MAEEQARCILCQMQEKKERIVNRLIERRIPPDEWDHFLEIPGHMDHDAHPAHRANPADAHARDLCRT